jgi:hypothetical protein
MHVGLFLAVEGGEVKMRAAVGGGLARGGTAR